MPYSYQQYGLDGGGSTSTSGTLPASPLFQSVKHASDKHASGEEVEENVTGPSLAQIAAATLGRPVYGLIAGGPASFVAGSLVKKMQGEIPVDNPIDIARLSRMAPDDVSIDYRPLGGLISDAYDPFNKRVTATNTQTLAHELGHAKAHKALGKLYPPLAIGSRLAMRASFLAPIALLAGTDEETGLPSDLALTGFGGAGVVGTGGGVATLIDEANASYQGRKMLKSMGYSKLPSYGRNMVRALGTYAASGLLPGLTTIGIAAGLKKYKDHLRDSAEEAMADMTDGVESTPPRVVDGSGRPHRPETSRRGGLVGYMMGE